MRLTSTVLAICFCLGVSQCALSQTPDEVADDFRISKSIGIGLSGVSTSTQLSVEDDFGVAYDTFSLLGNRAVREMVGVSEEDYVAISQSRSELVEEMESMVVSAVYSDEYRDRIRSRFFEAEDEVRATLTEDQIQQLSVARAKVGMDQHGLEYLAVPDVAKSLGISDSSAKRLRTEGSELLKLLKTKKQELLKDANKELVDELSDSESKVFRQLLNEKTQKRFLSTPLFVVSKKKQKKVDLDSKRRSILSRTYIRRKLDLTTDQVAELDALDESDGKAEWDFLSEEQLLEIDRLAIVPDFKKQGTVVSLTEGLLGQRVELSETRREEVLEFGKKLGAGLKRKIAETTNSLLAQQFDLTSEGAVAISKLLAQ